MTFSALGVHVFADGITVISQPILQGNETKLHCSLFSYMQQKCVY